MQRAIRFTLIVTPFLLLIIAIFLWPFYGLIAFLVLIVIIGVFDSVQKKHTILRNFPVLGHIRYLFEMIGPEIHQYFVESDTDGKPIDLNHRVYVYERAKKQNETHPFGTELDVKDPSFTWMRHSMFPSARMSNVPRIRIGGKDCKQPYDASLFNISAMSYGALGKNAITALNIGAREGGFYHNTGEGGISPYHLQGGHLVYQLGTGYFGARTPEGHFSASRFSEQAARKEVKMVEVKVSQGAKPGHGGVLPAVKNTREIAEIRGIEPHKVVLSPPGHQAFSNPTEFVHFIKKLRDLSGGKPIGFKICIGSKQEFEDICKAIKHTGIAPDFITVDGAEGGTGAAPIDFTNYVGMPWESALVFVADTLEKHRLRSDIKIITATKIITAFDIFKALCLGADLCNSARGMMLALGCIQAIKCNTNNCPTGITTNKKYLMKGLVVAEKWKRVKNYHEEILKDFLELFAASGCKNPNQLDRSYIYRREELSRWITH